MTSQFFDNLGPVDSTMEVFQTAFAKSSAFFISLGLLIVLSRVFVRFTTANYRGALTNDQIALLVVASVTLGFAHLFLCWAYTSHDVKGFTTAPSIYLADRGFTVVLRGAINVESARNLAQYPLCRLILYHAAMPSAAATCKTLPHINTAHDQHAPEASNCVLQVIARALISLEAQSSVENIASDVIDRYDLAKYGCAEATTISPTT
ncbi:hypothetical protein M436DRAFT_64248 [Aureobasidium namibiae CBS 147.97]|uniref:Uncharacterized protein n=1 Tax=Aureobasidium namibiae CBS 147.97 TaxID=1043004 RepID=A0A074WJ78_9PEZI|nr:uncharacterized protein M436DRAFT_64248 [Aureobasidium namibiae CBS 147.97]KEQ73093.1 hypothetical protein M436DRAFT_64248 [Aureobasidium namibiae CBS 147.97]